MHGRIGSDLAAVPMIGCPARLGGNQDLIGGLPRTVAVFGVEPPAQTRRGLVNAKGIFEVLATQMDGTAGCLRHGVVGRRGTPAIWLRQLLPVQRNRTL